MRSVRISIERWQSHLYSNVHISLIGKTQLINFQYVTYFPMWKVMYKKIYDYFWNANISETIEIPLLFWRKLSSRRDLSAPKMFNINNRTPCICKLWWVVFINSVKYLKPFFPRDSHVLWVGIFLSELVTTVWNSTSLTCVSWEYV